MDFPRYLNATYFTKILENSLHLNKVDILEVALKDLTIGGENYCSNIYQAIIKFKTTDTTNDAEEILKHIVIKIMPEEKQNLLKHLQIYHKETIFYTIIKPKMETLMRYMTDNMKWHLAAQHLYSMMEPEHCILFEDLNCDSWVQGNREHGLDLQHTQIVLKKLAEYHALSMVIAEKEPEIIVERFPFGLLNTESIQTPNFKMLFGGQLLKLSSLLSEDCEYIEISKKLLNYYDHFTNEILKAVYPLKGAINVLNHGDLWVNNLFFQYGENSKDLQRNVKEVKMIDFQLSFYGSLGFDINYFFNTSVQLNVLEHHYDDIIDLYSETLRNTLQQLSHKGIPTKTQILNEINEREAYGFFVAYAFLPLISMKREVALDNSLENLQNEEFAKQKCHQMFMSNSRTMTTLKYLVKRLHAKQII